MSPLVSVRRRAAVAFCLGAVCSAPRVLAAQNAGAADPVVALIAAFDSMARRDLWPGFRPDTIPLAIFDGRRTILVRHPAPPDGFTRVSRAPVVAEMEGRYAEVTANSSADIGGRKTATLMPRFDRSSPADWAAVMAHESFHVFQRARHRTWQANEADLFTYPFDAAAPLALRRLEYAALRRALEAADDPLAACWGRVAMDARQQRFAQLGEAPALYERRGELNEGLANYVQLRAAAKSVASQLPAAELPPERVRDRVYLSGAAMGQLLDRLRPAWRQELELADSAASLDGALTRAVANAAAGSCGFTSAERAEAEQTAARDAGALAARLAAEKAAFDSAPGSVVEVDASRATLFVKGFDPLNVSRVSPSEILHQRYLALTNAGGELEAIDRASLTEGAGAHPLFGGVKSLRLTGFSTPPTVTERDGAVEVVGDGVRLRFKGATVTRHGRRIRVTLAKTP